MFDELRVYQQAFFAARQKVLREPWNELAADNSETIPIVPIFGSSNLFFPFSFDRQLTRLLQAQRSRLRCVKFGSFGFCTSRFVLESTVQLLEWSPRRPLAALVFEVTGNDVPVLRSRRVMRALKTAVAESRIIDCKIGAEVRSLVADHDDAIERNLERLARLLEGAGRAGRIPVVLLGQETNCSGWPPSASCFSRPVSPSRRLAFQASLDSAIGRFERGDVEGSAEAARRCAEIDPNVAILHFLTARIAAARGDPAAASQAFVAARDTDLLRGALGGRAIMAKLPGLASALGFRLIDVAGLVRSFAGRAPGFESFVDEFHYRPEVHRLLARALLTELAGLGLASPPDEEGETDRNLSPDLIGDRAAELVHAALEIAQAPRARLDDERVAAGRGALAQARRLGCPSEVCGQAEARFETLVEASIRRSGGEARAAAQGAKRAQGETFIAGLLGFDPFLPPAPDDWSAVAAVVEEVVRNDFGATIAPGDIERPLKELGIDSLAFLQLLMILERRFDIGLDADSFAGDSAHSPQSLARWIVETIRHPRARRRAHRTSMSRHRITAARPLRDRVRRLTMCHLPENARTFTAALEHQMRTRSGETALTLLDEGHKDWRRAGAITWQELTDASAFYAGSLAACGLRRGDRLLLLTGHGRTTIVALVAAMRMGLVASLLNAPSIKTSTGAFREMFEALAGQNLFDRILAPRRLAARLRQAHPDRADSILAAETLWDLPPAAWDAARPAPGDIALVQYSSGTTGLRKAVAITHHSLMTQLRTLAQALELRDDDTIVSWLPLYHDMGLIVAFALPLASGVPVATMSPFDWLARPSLLFDAITAERGTLAFMPNFAFNLMVERVGASAWDLSSLRALVNCSEPVQPEPWERLQERFEPHGLSRLAHSTCYALAEATFAVTFAGVGSPPLVVDNSEDVAASGIAPGAARSGACALLSSGTPLGGVDVRILDGDGSPVANGVVGGISIACPFLAVRTQGKEASDEPIGPDWYRTGDVGFRKAGHVFVLGRATDMMVVAGQNLFPDDLERATRTVSGIRRGRVAAFGIWSDELGTERLVVAAELLRPTVRPETLGRIEADIRMRLRDAANVILSDLLLLPPDTLTKTSSGKVARSRIREQYRNGELQSFRLGPPRGP